MTRRQATLLGIVSAVALIAAVALWAVGDDDRADLVGPTMSTAATVPTRPGPGEPDPSPMSSTTTAVPSAEVPAPAPPGRLVIPTIGVDAPVVPVGLEPDGAMEVPPATEAGWYLYGPLPGDPTGSAVIAAHVDHSGRAGVFFDLRRVVEGDEVVVLDEAGTERRYRVTERFQVDKDELPIPELFRHDGAPVLTLITCGGAFDRGAGHYEDNIVVRAVPA